MAEAAPRVAREGQEGELLIYVSRIAVLVALLLPPVRRWFFTFGLQWAYLVSFAFSTAFLLVPVVRALALRAEVIDQPAERKVHQRPTPLLGGLALFLACAIALLINFHFSSQLKGVALGATVLVLVGVLDDILEIRATWKLLAQGVAAAIAVNYGVLLTLLPYRTVWGYWGDVILTILWFVGITNALQFLDGMDGLASGLGVIAAFFFSMVALQTGQDYLMFLSAALLGACLGFLPYNFRPWSQATIFLGDAGSSFIGFTLAGLAVMGEWAEGNPLVALTTPLLILSVPIFDIAVVSTARVVTGRVKNFREWLAYVGKDHIHHRFVLLGLSKTRAVLLIHFLSISLGISALLIKSARIYEALLLLVQAACVLLIILILEATGRRGTPG